MGFCWRSYRSLTIILILIAITSCMNKSKSVKVLIHNGIGREPLDPSNLGLSDQYLAMDNMLVKILEINKDNDYSHLLAETIDVSEDKLKYTISIRDAKFSDGSRITSSDVINSFKRVILKGSNHVPLKEIIEGSENISKIEDNLTGLKEIDDRKIKITLNKPTKEFLYYLSMADLGILHSSQYKSDIISNEKYEITSGAYFLKEGKLIRNEFYLEKNEKSPTSIEFINPPSTGTTDDFNGYDIGTSSFVAKDTGSKTTPPNPFKYTTSNYDTLCYIVLNTKTEMFKDLGNRQYVSKNILKKVSPPDNNLYFKKAYQFFLPDSFAFQKKFSFEEILSKEASPNEVLKKGFKILATKGTRKYTFPGLEKSISEALGLNVSVDFVDEIERFRDRKEKRDFDAYLVPTSMSYSVITESLNILYKAPIRFGNNPSNKIIQLIDQYQSNLQKNENVIEEITKEMTRESEIIPLFYVSSPYFYNSDRIDISQMNVNESLKFWKMNVK